MKIAYIFCIFKAANNYYSIIVFGRKTRISINRLIVKVFWGHLFGFQMPYELIRGECNTPVFIVNQPY